MSAGAFIRVDDCGIRHLNQQRRANPVQRQPDGFCCSRGLGHQWPSETARHRLGFYLKLLVAHTAGLCDVVFVAIGPDPAAGLALIQAQFTHAAAQRTQLPVPHGRGRAVQGKHRRCARADHFAGAVQEPVIAPLYQVV
ncbi:hypothetical protein D3C80_1431050 [compost metagenome]